MDYSIDSAPPSPRAWLEQWPPARRSLIANLFCSAVRAGASTPAAVVAAVEQDIQRRLSQAMAPYNEKDLILLAVLAALQRAPNDVQGYASTVISWETLPAEVRQHQKDERRRTFQRESMATQPVTARQIAFLRLLGYQGPQPTNRLEASEIITTLQKGKP